MSSALAVAAVTASLKDLLNDGLMDHDLSTIGSFTITAQPPDRVTTGATESNQLNLFLYQVTPNPGWRNIDLPSRDGKGARLSNPPLALDLHYLLTAYGAQDMNAEVLLGYAMQVLHENPVLTRQQLRTALGGAPSPVDGSILPGPFGTLSAADVADQIEMIKVVPVFLSSEELSKLWTAMQARYRTSMAYSVSVVLIQSTLAAAAPLPVLQRSSGDRGPNAQAAPPPALSGIRPAVSPSLPAARLGDDLLVFGTNLFLGGTTAVFESMRLGITQELPLSAAPSANQLSVHLPSIVENAGGMSGWGVGVFTVALHLVQSNTPTWVTNSVPIALAPQIGVSPLNASVGTVNLTLTCTPRLQAQQTAGARLLFGSIEVVPNSVDTPVDPLQPTTLQFSIPNVTAGSYLIRLRVDGIDSLPVRLVGSPPVFNFDAQQMVTVA